jgi:hypothetical protein
LGPVVLRLFLKKRFPALTAGVFNVQLPQVGANALVRFEFTLMRLTI